MSCDNNKVIPPDICVENCQQLAENVSNPNLKYQVVQINGCRQYGPPRNFVGITPGKDSELFVCRIPKNFTEIELIPILEHYGVVFQFRLMMDYSNQNRGYGYVVYLTPESATCALELLPHFVTSMGIHLDVKRSYDKCRLFVGNLPRDVESDAIQNTFRMIYPEMCNFIIHTRTGDETKNRGFAFIDFPNHQSALRSKKAHGSGTLRLWDRVIRVVWAKEERAVDPDAMNEVKTLFVRNIQSNAKSREFEVFLLQFIPQQTVVKMTQVRDFAFIDFSSRSAALEAYKILSQKKFSGNSLSVEWAFPPSGTTQEIRKLSDFDSLLKLKCVANGWNMPIYIFGRLVPEYNIQYVAVILKNTSTECVTLFEINTTMVPNIHQRIAEVMVRFVERFKGVPSYNFIIKLYGNQFRIVGFVYESSLNFRVAETEYLYDFNEIVELTYAAYILCQSSPGLLLFSYQQALSFSYPYTYIHSICTPHRILGCIPLHYRKTPPWETKGNYPDNTIILALCDKYTRTNYQYTSDLIRMPIVLNSLDDIEKYNTYYAIKLTLVKNNYKTCGVFFGGNITDEIPR